MVTTAADTGFLGVLAAITIALLICLAALIRWLWTQAGRLLTELADPTPTAAEVIREAALVAAVHAHDQDMDQLMQAADCDTQTDEFVTEFRKWQARQ